ncbi:hypothetical protein M9H77_20795 [Catharanthus roseus]|uniref:Uncharacterized protein n=1 Tax=Catharanthus roseus TaxID=4058 RepID=A0ACC0AN87_CATRO|nr:hypothetical protein M9H77_20795 [Catharanthus roseus]
MPSSEKQGSGMPFASFRRSILHIKGDQVHSVESSQESNSLDPEMELFQKQVFSRFHELSMANADEFLSISWIQKLLDAFTSCQEDFRVILSNNKAHLSNPTLEKLLSEFFDKAIKALDICNATREGIEKIRQWQKNLDIVVCALDCRHRMISEGQFRRARKALMDLALLMLEEKESGSVFSHRNRSFGRVKNKEHQRRQSAGHSRSLSWSVPNSWSASKQLQSIANNLVPPRGNEIAATNGLAVIVFTMSFVLMFVLWILVAALPCQDRGHQIQFAIPRQFSWGTSFFLLHSRIIDEFKKQERRDSNGLLKEIYQMEKCIHHMTDLVDSAQFPLTEEQKEEVRYGVQKLSSVCEVCKTGLDPLDRQVREVFRKIMCCRNEGLEFLGRVN